DLANRYRTEGMAAYAKLQEQEFGMADRGYTAVKHQQEVGTGYFDDVANVISGGGASTLALGESTEAHQF
ncbi:MAG: isocitrate lyase, partial [Myxococcales bacterium]|nr:isocitrate lyase [Myxococcales bacterium]